MLPSPATAGVTQLVSDYNVLHECTHAIVVQFNPQAIGWSNGGQTYDYCSSSTADPALQASATGDHIPTAPVAVDRAAQLAQPPPWQKICRGGPDIGALEACP